MVGILRPAQWETDRVIRKSCAEPTILGTRSRGHTEHPRCTHDAARDCQGQQAAAVGGLHTIAPRGQASSQTQAVATEPQSHLDCHHLLQWVVSTLPTGKVASRSLWNLGLPGRVLKLQVPAPLIPYRV